MKKYELVVLAMYTLDGSEIALDIEDIAMKCEELSPGTFAWRKYKNQINLELVGFAVRDAKKEKYGAYVAGTHAKGWRLTPAGAKLGKELDEQVKSKGRVSQVASRDNSLETKRVQQDMKRISESEAFLNWEANGVSDLRQLKQLLKINAYSSNDLVSIKISRLEKIRGIDNKLDSFLDYLDSIKGDLA